MHERRRKAMAALLCRSQPRHDLYTVFSDCMEVMAIAMANSVDRPQFDRREARYLQIVRQYRSDVVDLFPRVLAELVNALEAGISDVLGPLFHDFELHNKARGQFFTPYSICQMMADGSFADEADLRARIDQRGYIRAMEPACGAGSMVIALAETMKARGINYQRHLHVTAIDIDPRAVHMAYSQLSLLHVPAHLMVGNSLSGEIAEHWFTPAHIFGGWNARLAAVRDDEVTGGPITPIPNMHAPALVGQPAEVPPVAAPAAPRQLSLF
ncbi:hypothetical protein BV96_03267 [Sphingomonas paucimobilis]|nr:hypothetical protein BV96_03267 [Sphingomonas paucimobilis]